MSIPAPVPTNEGVGSSSSPGPAAPSQGPSGSVSYNATTQIGSMNALREKAPEVYQSMMKGVAMNIISSMRRAQEHLKETMRKARQDAGEA